MEDTKYCYSLQHASIEVSRLRETLFEGDMYTDIDKFIQLVNEQIEEYVYIYEIMDRTKKDEEYYQNSEKISEFIKNNKLINYLDYYPITRENLQHACENVYIYYDKDCCWGLLIYKHKIV